MKSKEVVRTQAKRHKKAITCLTSSGKYLISCSMEDNLIVVYDYQMQQEQQDLSLQGEERPQIVLFCKEH